MGELRVKKHVSEKKERKKKRSMDGLQKQPRIAQLYAS